MLPFPSQEVDPYRGLAPHLRVASARARALYGASAGEARIVIASAVALLPEGQPAAAAVERGAQPRARRSRSRRTTSPSCSIDAGFTREDPVDEHGEFCVRGGIVDLFPPGAAEPFRVEFIGDTIETIRRYDPATQRSTGSIDQVHIMPMREALDAGVGGRPGGAERDGLRSLPQGAAAAVRRDARSATCRRRRTRFLEQVEASYTEATSGRRPARVPGRLPQPSEILIDWDTVASRLAAATRFEELAIDTPADDHVAGRRTGAAASATCPASRRWSSAAACRTGWPRFVRLA